MALTERRIAYVPHTDVNNAYVSRMQEILRRFGSVEQFMRPRQFVQELLSGRFRRYDVTFFNWVENDFLEKGSGRITRANVAKVVLKTLVARLLSRRLIFVRHNIYPHSLRTGDEASAVKLIRWYERFFHEVLIHSGAHLEGRYRYVPHPMYRQADEARSAVPQPIPDLPEHYFVMFGRVAPYKCIAETARGFPAESNLLIIGSVTDKAYDREIAAIDRPNVFYRPGYIDDAAAQILIRRSKGIVLAHAGENTVVSGSFFYAMSLPVPVLAVETPFLRWVQPQVERDLLVLAPNLQELMELVRRLEPLGLPVENISLLEQAFGDEAIAIALKPVLMSVR